jgi:ketosteroid isomerase-like protein
MSADSSAALERAIARYNEAWNAHDLDAIMEMHAPDMVFENHTAGESAEGEAVREHIGSIFETWPDIRFEARRTYARVMASLSRSGARQRPTRTRCAAAIWKRRRRASGSSGAAST